MGVDVHFGNARFLSDREIDVEGVGRLRSNRFVIATGARPFVPPIPGLEEAGYLTYESLFETDALPDRVTVLGAGPIGLEMAQVMTVSSPEQPTVVRFDPTNDSLCNENDLISYRADARYEVGYGLWQNALTQDFT